MRDTLIPKAFAPPIDVLARHVVLPVDREAGAPELRVTLVIRGRWTEWTPEDAPLPVFPLKPCYALRVQSLPRHAGPRQFPGCQPFVSRSFASTTDPKAATAIARASCSKIQSIVLVVPPALAMAHPRGFGLGQPRRYSVEAARLSLSCAQRYDLVISAFDQRHYMIGPPCERRRGRPLVAASIVDAGNATPMAAKVVQARLYDVWLDADVGHVRCDRSANIVQPPWAHGRQDAVERLLPVVHEVKPAVRNPNR